MAKAVHGMKRDRSNNLELGQVKFNSTTYLQLHGKGRKERVVPLCSASCPSLLTKRVTPHLIRHYLPFLIMSCNGESPRIWLGERKEGQVKYRRGFQSRASTSLVPPCFGAATVPDAFLDSRKPLSVLRRRS
jgi:hypothetical protein